MKLFDRFKKKVEDLYENISSSATKKEIQAEVVGTIPSAPISNSNSSSSGFISEADKRIALQNYANNFKAEVDKLSRSFNINDFENLNLYISQDDFKNFKKDLYPTDSAKPFVLDFDNRLPPEESERLMKHLIERVELMQSEYDVLKRLDKTSIHLGLKDSLPVDEATLMHRISSWDKIKGTVDLYTPGYKFNTDLAESTIDKYKESLKDNPYIVCSELIKGETALNKIDLDNFVSLKKLKDEFSHSNFDGPIFSNLIKGIDAVTKFEKLDDSFKTERMNSTVYNISSQAEDIRGIISSLKDTGTIPALDKGLDLGTAFAKQYIPKIKDEDLLRPKPDVSKQKII